MQKRTEELLQEYPRSNETATRVANNVHVPKPEPLEMARFSEREERNQELFLLFLIVVCNWSPQPLLIHV